MPATAPGEGIAAGVALLARDRGGPALTRQVLIYPMLDDRNVEAPADASPVQTWSYDDNVTGWGALLGDAAGGPDVSAYAAPARATDLSGLPATYVMVGDLDIFRDEDVAYAARLAQAGVEVELHLHPGGPHAFELFAPTTALGGRAYADEIRVLQGV